MTEYRNPEIQQVIYKLKARLAAVHHAIAALRAIENPPPIRRRGRPPRAIKEQTAV